MMKTSICNNQLSPAALLSSVSTYLDLLGGQEVPVCFQFSTLHLLIVDLDLVGVVWVHNEGVQVSVDIILAADVFLDQQVLALVVEDNMHFLGAWPTDVRSCKKKKLGLCTNKLKT